MSSPNFVSRKRKRKAVEQHQDITSRRTDQDTNAIEIMPKSKAEAEELKAALREKLNLEGVRISSKKAKRLDRYMETKLRQDEKRLLLARLADNRIETSVFASSRVLGQGRETKKELLKQALKEREAGLNAHEDLLFELRRDPEVDESGTDGQNAGAGPSSIKAEEQASTAPTAPAAAPILPFGIGLKRPLQVDDKGRPVIAKKQKRGGVKSKISLAMRARPEKDKYDEWNGFSDDDAGISDREEESESDHEESSKGDTREGEGVSRDDESTDGEDDSAEDRRKRQAMASAFKAWAVAQRYAALGCAPTGSEPATLKTPNPANFKPRPLEQDPLPRELEPTENDDRKAFSVAVTRDAAIQAARLRLPVVMEEQKIMEAIHNNAVVVLCGATGSGKTTQVPQFLVEAGYGSPDGPTPGMIGVTQPRRVAAISMAKRVAEELGSHGRCVGYQIRYDSAVDSKTAVKFMTDGVLLRELANDISLRKYSAIIIDEAHERTVNTDILIGMLSRVVRLRADLAREDAAVTRLKLIIMSATLQVEEFTDNTQLFSTPPPVLEVEGRQHPVKIHFSRTTRHDYVEEAFDKVCRGHKKLPPGNFLVFLTGQNEIVRLKDRLDAAFGKVWGSSSGCPPEVEDLEVGGGKADINAGADHGLDMDDEDDMFEMEDEEAASGLLKVAVLPFYSRLPTSEQLRVFQPTPEKTRVIVLATNVAETSITVPGVRYVFDSGRVKERRYKPSTGVQSFEIEWISKASASQRAGRAGRTCSGHCYRLFSSAVFERDFAQFTVPELLRMPLESVVLLLKSMNLDRLQNFPFPTPLDRRSLEAAEKVLVHLTALDLDRKMTKTGHAMATLPLSPRFSRILLAGHVEKSMPYAIALVAGLSVADIFIPQNQAVTAFDDHDSEARSERRGRYSQVQQAFCCLDDKADAIKLLQAVAEFAHEPTEAWCERHFVRFKALRETRQLCRQITDVLRTRMPECANLRRGALDALPKPTDKQVRALKQITALAFVDQVAIRADKHPTPPAMLAAMRKPRRAVAVPYLPLVPLEAADTAADGLVYIHPSSVLARLSVAECPDYVVYAHLQRTGNMLDTPADADEDGAQPMAKNPRPKTRMIALTDVTGTELAALAKGTTLLSYGKPIKELTVSGDGKEREVLCVPYLGGGRGWPLPAKVVKQKRVTARGWVVEG